MNGDGTRWWRLVLGCSLALTLLGAPARAAAQTVEGAHPSATSAPERAALQETLGRLGAAWWQWALQFTNAASPITDPTGARCGSGQSGPVWFLAGAAGSDPVTRTCTVPFGKALFFPLITVECSNLEVGTIFFGEDARDRRRCAAGFIDDVPVASLKLTVDHLRLQGPVLARLRAASPDFAFTSPPQDNFLGVTCRPPACRGRAAADGYWALIPPLPRGRHELHFEAAFASGPLAGFSQNVTYHLTVQ